MDRTLSEAVQELCDRGLHFAARWLAELHCASSGNEDEQRIPEITCTKWSLSSDQRAYNLAKRYYDMREYEACTRSLQGLVHPTCTWLRLYCTFLTVNACTSSGKNVQSDTILSMVYELRDTNDAFLLYLRGLALSVTSQRAEAITSLVQSVSLFPYNWSAWLKIVELLDGEDELYTVMSKLPPSFMTEIFEIVASLEVHRATEALRDRIHSLQRVFPESLHLMAQLALLDYHLRDFDAAETQFDQIYKLDPSRTDNLETYSNILYVMGNRAKLSQLAHHYMRVDRNRPETCCLIGNFYSLRGEHGQAITYFRRAIKLDGRALSAWTLMGHEYVEMANTHAAIEAYRNACDIDRKDYRAWYGLGQAYEILGMHTYSLRYFQRAACLRPFDMRMWQALANSYSKLSRPHETLKCLKRAQLLAEQDDVTVLLRLGDQCLSMQLFSEAAVYWMRIVDTSAGAHSEDLVQVYNLLAAFEMGEHHVAHRKMRVVGDLALADLYLAKALAVESDATENARKLQRILRTLQIS